MKIQPDERIEYARAVWETFKAINHSSRFGMSPSEFVLIGRWMDQGVPLAVVLQGLHEVNGRVGRLEACERSVEANISRWFKAMGGLPLEGVKE